MVLTKPKIEKESETPKTTSSKPSPQRRSARKKTKEPSLDSSTEEEEAKSSKEEEVESSGEEPESEEKAEPSIPLPEKKKKIETQAFDRKKPASIFKTLISLKRPTKTPRKEESS